MTHESLPLVMYDDSNSYYIPQQAEEALRSFGEESIAVISIIGKPKSGKSYILNHISSNPTAFQVNSQVMTSTKGIQMSVRLFNLEGKRVLLLDNQSFSSSINSVHDSKMFFINMLLSSVLIYNNFGVIDEHALAHLSLIIGMGQLSQTTINKDWNVQKPHLLWLVRDFILKLETPAGDPCTAKEYLEKILDEQKGLTSSITQKNCIRTMIKEMFAKRDCETLVRPAKQQKDLYCLEKIPFCQLRKQFLNDVKRLKTKLGKSIKYKKVNGQFLTASLLLKLVKGCLNSFNNNNILPNIHGIWTMVQSQQKREISGKLQSIEAELKEEVRKGKIKSIESLWDQKVKSINTLNNPQLVAFVRQRKEQLLKTIKEEQQDIVPITFDGININFLESVIHKNYRLEDNFDSSNKNEKKTIQIQLNYPRTLEKELESTRKELELVQQKCRSFEKQRQKILKAIETKDKFIEDISRKRDSMMLSKSEEDQPNVVAKLLEMYQKLEQKYQKVNQMSKHTLAYICSHCKAKFEPNQFERHIEKIKNQDASQERLQTPISIKSKGEISITEPRHQPKASFFTPYIIIPKGILSVDIEKTLIKEDQQHRNYIEYIIKVSLKHSKWTINRKYKDFCELHDILLIMLPELDFPDSSALIKVGMLTSVSNNVNKKNIVQERRKTLQNYLTSIIDIDEVRNTRILQKFLKVNQQYKELQYFDEGQNKSKSPLGFDLKNDSRSSVSKIQTNYSQTKKYAQTKVR